jgi:hypothetical protein
MSDADNPYLPPKAVVADPVAETPTTRPMSVNIALILIGVRLLWTSTWLVQRLRRTSDIPIDSAILIAALAAAITVPLAVAVARGRNWARIVFLVLAAVAVLSAAFAFSSMSGLAPEGFTTQVSWTALSTTLIPTILLIAIVVLLFGPGRAWFRPRE